MVSKDLAERRIGREVLGLVLFAGLLVLIFLGTQYFLDKHNEFSYKGLSFVKTTFGDFPVYYYYYHWTDDSGKSYRYNLYLRTDPRINMVTVEGDPLEFKTKKVYYTIDTANFEQCKESAAAISDLALFLKDNQFYVEPAVMNHTLARATDRPYVTCEKKNDTMVLEVFRGNETKISVDGFCVRLSIGPQCDVFNATEKLKVESILQARGPSIRQF